MTKHSVFLNQQDVGTIKKNLDLQLNPRLITRFHVNCKKSKSMTVYLDRHVLRTKPQLLAVAINASSRVRSVRVLRFYEPVRYKPAARWYALFNNKDPKHIDQEVALVTGATITSRVTKRVARELLMVHQYIEGRHAKD
jgi:hypothetical protein